MKREKIIDMSQFRYYPEDKRKLELEEIIWKMRDFRLLDIFLFPVWVIWAIMAASMLYVFRMSNETMTTWILGTVIIFVCLMIPLGATLLPRLIAKNKDIKKGIVKNAYRFFSNVENDFLEQLQTDLYKGLPFMKKHNLAVSERYIIGFITYGGLDPIAIPKEQITEIAYAGYTLTSFTNRVNVQELYFRLKNGKEISMPVSDPGNLGLTLCALQDCGVSIIDISDEKKYGKREKQ